MSFIPEDREERKWLLVIAVSVFLLNLFYLLRPDSPSWSWFSLYPIFGLVIGFLNKMSLTRSLYISFEGAFVGALPYFFSPYALSALFFLGVPILYFLFGTVIGKRIKEKYIHHSTVELSRWEWIWIIVMFYWMFDFIVFLNHFYLEMYRAHSPLLLLFFIAFFVVGILFGFLLKFEEKKTFRVILKGILIAHCSFLIFLTLLGKLIYFSLFTGVILFFSIIGSYFGVKLQERRAKKG